MRTARILGAAGILCAVAISEPAGGREPNPRQEIQQLLDRRAAAILHGDRPSFLSTVARDQPIFHRRQARLFDGFQRLGVGSYDLRATARLWPELTTGRDRVRYGRQVAVLHVEERYAIRGYDARPAVEDLYLTFVRDPDGWRVASDADLEDLALYSGRKLWETGPIRTRSSEHFLFVSHPDVIGAAKRVLRAAERGLRTVRSRWSLPWTARVLILAPSDEQELRRLIQASFDLDVFVAFAASGVDRNRDWTLVGHRILLNWPNFARYPASSREAILAHELLHIATRDHAGPMTPIFVEEGLAEWVTGAEVGSTLGDLVRGGRFDRRLPEDHEFISGAGTEIHVAYEESTAAMTYAAKRFGEARLATFYETLGEIRRAPGLPRYHVDRAMNEVFGVGLTAFERGWARSTERAARDA